MGRKKRKDAPRVVPWCYYCDKEFDEMNQLLQHQKAKHFRCPECRKKFLSAPGMGVHMKQMHNVELKEVPDALDGRKNPKLDISGMEGIPMDDQAVVKRMKLSDATISSSSSSMPPAPYMGQMPHPFMGSLPLPPHPGMGQYPPPVGLPPLQMPSSIPPPMSSPPPLFMHGGFPMMASSSNAPPSVIVPSPHSSNSVVSTNAAYGSHNSNSGVSPNTPYNPHTNNSGVSPNAAAYNPHTNNSGVSPNAAAYSSYTSNSGVSPNAAYNTTIASGMPQQQNRRDPVQSSPEGRREAAPQGSDSTQASNTVDTAAEEFQHQLAGLVYRYENISMEERKARLPKYAVDAAKVQAQMSQLKTIESLAH